MGISTVEAGSFPPVLNAIAHGIAHGIVTWQNAADAADLIATKVSSALSGVEGVLECNRMPGPTGLG